MAHNALSPEHQVDHTGETLLDAIIPLGLPDHVLQELNQYAESAGEILLEEAESHRRSGEDSEQGIRILDALMAHAPEVEDRQYAAGEKLRWLLGEKTAEANAQAERLLGDLTEPGVLQEGPAGLVAEILVERGRLESALVCYDIAARKHLAGRAEDLSDVDLMSAFPLIGRAEVRRELGYAPDAFDSVVRKRKPPEEVMAGLFGPSEQSPDRSMPGPVQPERGQGRQVLCRREDFALAMDSGLLDGAAAEKGADEYFRAGERILRENSREHTDLDWYTALFSVAEIREFARGRGGDPADRELQDEWGRSLAHDDPRLRLWPPERNKPCWCDSGRKYKKCCGSPSVR